MIDHALVTLRVEPGRLGRERDPAPDGGARFIAPRIALACPVDDRGEQ